MMLALNELKHIASGHGDNTLIDAIQNLALVRLCHETTAVVLRLRKVMFCRAQLLSRNHAWEPPVVQSYIQQKAQLPVNATAEDVEVDDETANWLVTSRALKLEPAVLISTPRTVVSV